MGKRRISIAAAALLAAACGGAGGIGGAGGGEGEPEGGGEDTQRMASALTTLTNPAVANPPLVLNLPNPPNLFGPLDGHTIYMSNGIPMKTFSWDPPIGAPVPAFYIFWWEEVAATGGFKSTPVEVSYWPGRTSTDRMIPLALADKPARWYVAGCTGRTPALFGGFVYSCGLAASRAITWSTYPRAPGLNLPADGARVEPASASFSWWAIATITSYRFCAARTGFSCPDQPTSNDNVLVISQTGTSATVDLSRFRGQTIKWTAAACDNAGRCSYQTPRNVRVDEAPPVLALPADGATIPSLPTLSWSPVSWAADHYLVCVATPGTPCPNRTVAEGSDPNLVVVRTSNTTVGPGAGIIFPESIDLYQFKNMNVRWTVAACTSPPNWWGSEYCSWQPQTRSIRVVPDWYVGITLDRLEVHDDCDNFSAGDWRAAFSVSARKGLLITEFAWLDWPTSNGHGSRNVDSGTSLLVGQSLGLRVHETDTITFATAAVDCDNDGIWTLTNVFDGIEGVWNTIENWVQTCGGEEIYERSGDNDFVGTAVSSLGPAAWMGVHNLSVSATSPGGHDCGSNPYTAHFTVNAERR